MISRLRRMFWLHSWDYRNPYDRWCAVCGCHEVSHCSSLENWDDCWWEVFDGGDVSRHWNASEQFIADWLSPIFRALWVGSAWGAAVFAVLFLMLSCANAFLSKGVLP